MNRALRESYYLLAWRVGPPDCRSGGPFTSSGIGFRVNKKSVKNLEA